MKLTDVHAFFLEVGRHLPFSITVVITGGAAAIAYGVARATEDIDFEVDVSLKPSQRQEAWATLETVFRKAQEKTGIRPQFSEDIDRWSLIALPYKRSRPLWTLERVKVRLLEPIAWSVGKLTRYLPNDKTDVVTVFKQQHPSASAVARAWGQALRKSPSSNAQPLFKNNVRTFFRENAAQIWGKQADSERLFEIFFENRDQQKIDL